MAKEKNLKCGRAYEKPKRQAIGFKWTTQSLRPSILVVFQSVCLKTK